jgi:hypothetical protein
MAAVTPNDSGCATCGKAAGTFMCRGCSKDFCMRHANEHRQELAKQMEEDIIPLHDQLRQILDEQTKKPSHHHPLNKQIDEWEQASIEKIHQAAHDAREQLLNIISKRTDKLREVLEHLTQQLKKARDDDHFFETDLKEWMKKLDTLKKDLILPQTINIEYDNNKTSFISKILIGETANTSNECFEQSFGNIQITNNGTVITHNQSSRYAFARGRHEYSSGEHRLRFVIENLSIYKWVFLGVVSKSAPTQTTPSIGKTCYGFSGQNNVWRDGNKTNGLNGYKSNFETNDTIELLINCDQRKIHLINERTRSTHILDVDIVNCPFPWKLSVGFVYSPGERIRILS